MKKMKKSLIAILMTAVMLLPLVAPMLSIQPVQAAVDPSSWYKTVPGVLNTDYYSLYPYETNTSLTLGFSKFGELINSNDNVGLQYGGVDAFAPPAGPSETVYVPKRDWLNGWFINITYHHRILGDRNVWAGALFSDATEYGNDWIRVDFAADRSTTYGVEDAKDPGSLIYGPSPYSTTPSVNGGRKTNGTAVTADINVLYDGPREFIAECRTTIYDHPVFQSNSTSSDVGLVQVCITIVFDKVKKEVNLLKDVKSILIQKEGDSMKIQFSNRGEVDLGTVATSFGSYAHFYTQGKDNWNTTKYGGFNDTLAEGKPTVYDSNWELVRTEDPLDAAYRNYSAAGPYPQSSGATFDVAQAINDRAGYVWYAAFWPSLSDWSIDGWDNWWQSLMSWDPHYIDYRDGALGNEPFIPFYIGEWDFILYHTLDNENRTQFRGVTEYGIVYDHDASDANMDSINQIDNEVWYYLNETFNPWDLVSAVHKDTQRWVQFYNVTADDVFYASFGYALEIPLEQTPVLYEPNWELYAGFSERVLWSGALKKPYRSVFSDWQYELIVDSSGEGYIYIPATLVPAVNTSIKILYSTDTYWNSTANVGPLTFTGTYSIGENGQVANMYKYGYESWTDPLGVTHTAGVDDFSMSATILNTAADWHSTISPDDIYGWAQDFKVWKEHEYAGSWDYEDMVYSNANVSILFNLLDIHWFIEAPYGQDVHVWWLGFGVNMQIAFSYNATEDELNITATVKLETPNPYAGYLYGNSYNNLYIESVPGRNEWSVVGRDANPIDTSGETLVNLAFKNKQIELGLTGVTMFNPEVANQMPWVMAKFSTGNTLTSYMDSTGRAALKDDWCTYWPVASSNMIGVGGPLANLLAYYGNDFTNAFYGQAPYAGTAYSGKLTGIPCFNRNWDGSGYNTYSSSNGVGYAIISTYLDINGTVLFLVYGHWGRDTYYASQWLYGDAARGIPAGIQELQRAPDGVTSIILQIDYTDPSHPTFHVVEVLGTKSERLWYDWGEYKGGIHDP